MNYCFRTKQETRMARVQFPVSEPEGLPSLGTRRTSDPGLFSAEQTSIIGLMTPGMTSRMSTILLDTTVSQSNTLPASRSWGVNLVLLDRGHPDFMSKCGFRTGSKEPIQIHLWIPDVGQESTSKVCLVSGHGGPQILICSLRSKPASRD